MNSCQHFLMLAQVPLTMSGEGFTNHLAPVLSLCCLSQLGLR